jgi:hypothetical protein
MRTLQAVIEVPAVCQNHLDPKKWCRFLKWVEVPSALGGATYYCGLFNCGVSDPQLLPAMACADATTDVQDGQHANGE